MPTYNNIAAAEAIDLWLAVYWLCLQAWASDPTFLRGVPRHANL